MDMPELPDGYRWKVKPDRCDHSWSFSSYLGLKVCLQKRIGPVWVTRMYDCVKKGRNRETKQVMVVRHACHVLDSYTEQEAEFREKEALIGVYKTPQV